MLYSFLLASLAILLQGVQALEVTNTSSCIDTFGGESLTYYSDLTCIDDDYFSTSKGNTMRDCLVCESTSMADNGNLGTPQNNDIYWFLFNMKYTLQYCLFGSINSSTPSLPECQADCAGLYPVLETSWFSPTAAKQYEYCSINNTAFTQNAGACASCLQAGTGSVILGNFLNAMQSACTSQPDITLGETVFIERELFNTTTVGTATATATATGTGAGTASPQTSATVPTTSASATSSSTPASSSIPATQLDNKSSGLSTGAAAGIGVGCSIAVIALIAGLAWFFLSPKRRARRHAVAAGSEFGDIKTPFADQYGHAQQSGSTEVQGKTPFADQYKHAQQLGGTEVHEIDSTQGGKAWLGGINELDGRPMK
ncbi:hypothetical protein LTR10_015392 [Elasticomyces elasticus]|uniref:WSC domain-containing protein n=1 Tax=Exophiala sideris TaxID=1016849 RepID=A0ABR0JKT5_9EURO|nr:hypothetical protein LTR10_015392 [Elasticomyces elasticus]KAK5030208.1 hypothetical protein LTR13_008226 [Exophiala sideris]KAK5035136.1 hypothetical protein LTS07_002572 [Exophiala sideris]KAK5066059.1 hypothetical protein LTR69_002577 [Exophiala sideris]KAK5178272.1 hypothetical protein LTR44_009147 [Eurotiomycetes sp. CCFEE 6388]